MSVAAKTKLQQAPALVHRQPVRGGLVLSNAAWNSATLASGHSQHAGARGQRSEIAIAPLEAIDMRPNAPHQRGRSVESP